MTDRIPTSVRLESCQRCGEAHPNLQLEKLKNPADEYDYWAMCPNTNQPVFVMVVRRQ